MMRKLMSLLVTGVLALSLSACATAPKSDTTRVKCPACGYEFTAPMGG
ncbi:MAG: hypothetical protein IH614_14040 [Desulfuromonadales bacterium]|nr:hypothetical protein [Desulfuromonadales bacterium]